MLTAQDCLTGRVLHVKASRYSRERDRPEWVAQLLDAATGTCDVAYLQCCEGVQGAFEELCRFLRGVWAVNLGEIPFTDEQLEALLVTVQGSSITHMSLDLEYNRGDRLKERFQAALRVNRTKHSKWKLSEVDEVGKDSIRRCKHMWFDPINHGVNR